MHGIYRVLQSMWFESANNTCEKFSILSDILIEYLKAYVKLRKLPEDPCLT